MKIPPKNLYVAVGSVKSSEEPGLINPEDVNAQTQLSSYQPSSLYVSLETNDSLTLTSEINYVQPQDYVTVSVVQSSSCAGTSVENSEGPIQELIGTFSYILNEKKKSFNY